MTTPLPVAFLPPFLPPLLKMYPSGRGGDDPSAGQLQARLRLREGRRVSLGRQGKGAPCVSMPGSWDGWVIYVYIPVH